MASCTVEEFDLIDPEIQMFEPEVIYVNDIMVKARTSTTTSGVMVECITVSFPFQLIDTKRNLYDVSSSLIFNQLVNDPTTSIVDFVYPLDIIDNIGLKVTVNELWEFATYAAGCYPRDTVHISGKFPAYVINYENSCYNIKYPLEVQNEAGEKLVISDERTFIQKHAAQYLYFVFPFTIINDQGQEYVINDEFSLFNSLLDCNGFGWIDSTNVQIDQFATFACYEYVFPINILVFGQNSPISIPDATTLGNVFIQGRFVDFAYPLTLKTIDNQLVTAHNPQELNDLVNQCSFDGDFMILLLKTELFSNTPCYDLVFPVSVSNDGINKQLSSYQQINELISQDSLFATYNTNYPISIKLRNNNQIKTLESFQDLINVYVECPE
jgi:hypothetical protein